VQALSSKMDNSDSGDRQSQIKKAKSSLRSKGEGAEKPHGKKKKIRVEVKRGRNAIGLGEVNKVLDHLGREQEETSGERKATWDKKT